MLINKSFLNILKTSYDYREESRELNELLQELINKVVSSSNNEIIEETIKYMKEEIADVVIRTGDNILSDELKEYIVSVGNIITITEDINSVENQIENWIKTLKEDRLEEYRVYGIGGKVQYIDKLLRLLDDLRNELKQLLLDIENSKIEHKAKEEYKDIKIEVVEVEEYKGKKHIKEVQKTEYTLIDMIEIGVIKAGNILEEEKTGEQSKVTQDGYVKYEGEDMSMNTWVKLVRGKKTINAYETVILVETGEKLTAIRRRLHYKLNKK